MSLIQSSSLLNIPIMSLQTGTELGRTARLLVNPTNLHLVAFEIDGKALPVHPSVLRVADIREFSSVGIIVDSADELLQPGDVEVIDTLRSMKFDLGGMKVRDQDGQKYGTVGGYTLDSDGLVVMQLEVKAAFFQSFSTTARLIKRDQIVEISSDTIVVKSSKVKIEPVAQIQRPALVNPFTQPQAD